MTYEKPRAFVLGEISLQRLADLIGSKDLFNSDSNIFKVLDNEELQALINDSFNTRQDLEQLISDNRVNELMAVESFFNMTAEELSSKVRDIILAASEVAQSRGLIFGEPRRLTVSINPREKYL